MKSARYGWLFLFLCACPQTRPDTPPPRPATVTPFRCCELPPNVSVVQAEGQSCCQQAAHVTDAERICQRHSDCMRLNGDVVVNRAAWAEVRQRLATHMCDRPAVPAGTAEHCVSNRCVLTRAK